MKALLLALLLPAVAQAEICRFTGTTSHEGRLAARIETTQAAGLLTVDAAVEFTIRAWMTDYRYLGQEITGWRGAELQSIAVNQRYLADGAVKRQQWDVFTRVGDRFEGHRAQARRLAEFQQRFPVLTREWPPARFGQPWLGDFQGERRPDLDLPAEGVLTPLAFALYWSRFLPRAGGPVSLALPSFKRNKVVMLHLAPATPGEGWLRWSAPLVHPALSNSPASMAAAWVSPDHYLLQLGLDIHTDWIDGRAILRSQGCQGVQIRP